MDLGGSEVLYRHFDFRGNVKFVSAESGEVATLYGYSGYDLEAEDGLDVDDRTFALGRAIGSLILIGARPYDPLAARFVAPDFVYLTMNEYAYANGNSVEFWDPSGLASWRAKGDVRVKVDLSIKGKGVEVEVGGEVEVSGGGDPGTPGTPGTPPGGPPGGPGSSPSGGSSASPSPGNGSQATPTGDAGKSGPPSPELPGGPESGGCAPTQPIPADDARWLLAVVAPLHALLALRVLQRKRASRREIRPPSQPY